MKFLSNAIAFQILRSIFDWLEIHSLLVISILIEKYTSLVASLFTKIWKTLESTFLTLLYMPHICYGVQ